MRVLITGVQGYLGSRLSQYLLDHEIACDGCDPGLFADCWFQESADPPILFQDVRSLDEQVVARYDAVIHLAGVSNDPFGALSAEQVYDPTREYSRRLGQMCAATGTRLIFASSCSVYGKQGQELCDESAAPNPQTAYSQNKLDIERDLLEVCGDQCPLVILRFATAFGYSSRMRFDIVINMLAGLACSSGRVLLNSNGLAWRPHVDIEDICHAIKLSLDAETSPLVLNVGGQDCNLRIIDVAEHICSLVPNCELSFLNEDDAASHDLVRDRKIQDGVDSRTYRVSFEGVHKEFPEFQCVDVRQQIAKLVEELQKRELRPDVFEDPRFYRLQRYEWLMENEVARTGAVLGTT